jgi:inositol oxygenase
MKHVSDSGPLESFDEWEDDVKARYPEETVAQHKAQDEYRNYDDPARDTVRTFYRLNHEHQTLDFARAKRAEYAPLNRRTMGMWEAVEYLNTLVDDSDPDTDLSQIEHLLQTAEAIRADGHPDWFVLTGLIHDLGKIMCLWDEPQWAVVGDTFPLGCAFSDKIVYPEFFEANPDAQKDELQTDCGIYETGGGLDQVTMSWGHDEYMYLVAKPYLPEEALYMIRYHSFYAAHKEGAYDHLMNDKDREMFGWVQKFNPYDLYSKTPERPNAEKLRPYYEDLIAKYFPAQVAW